MLLFSLITNKTLLKRGNKWMQRRFLRLPSTIVAAGAMTYSLNYFILRPIYLSDLDQMGLTKKYFTLDLDADLMREDLENVGIII